MRLLVTGGAGFIGSNFIHYWFGKHPKDEIVNVDKMTYAADPRNLDGLEKYKHTLVEEDIVNSKSMERIVKDVDAVVNFAAETHVDNSIVNSDNFVISNIVGVHVLLEAAKKFEKRFHQVSTDEVYGSLSLDSKKRFTESSPYSPKNPYSATKAAADHLVNAYYNTYKMNVTISNCSNNYGPRQHKEKLIPKAISNALEDKKIPVYGRGVNIRDWIYVYDHCSAIEKILSKGKAGETYLVGSDSERHNIDVVNYVLGYLGKSKSLIEYVKDRPGHDLRYAIDASKIKKELGWKPNGTFEQNLDSTIDWYKERLTN
jgi:dTDP-glucose 4,6-dehydratase